MDKHAMLLSESEIKDELGSEVAIEFTRDSPFFRQQLLAFETSFVGIHNYAQGVKAALNGVDVAFDGLQRAQSALADALAGTNGHSRCLFTNAHPQLGNLSAILKMMSETFNNINKVQETFQESLKLEVGNILQELMDLDNEEERKLRKKELDRLYTEYETSLASALSSRAKPTIGKEMELVEIRKEYELCRFDMVADLNKLNGNKKRLLCQAVSSIYNCYIGFYYSATNFLTKKCQSASGRGEDYDKLEKGLIEVKQTARLHDELWDSVRQKLEGEVIGAAAPPGAPPGSLSPIQPRIHSGMAIYTNTLTTEVLSNDTRSAAYEDVRHARDDGVFKQGYLFINSGSYFMRPKRKWHRLFSSKLYIVENPKDIDDPSCESTIVADITGSSVTAKPGKIPHLFVLITAENKKIDLQAENDDEMVQWIQAIRRCAGGAPGRPKQMASSSSMASSSAAVVPSALIEGTASTISTAVDMHATASKTTNDTIFYDSSNRHAGPAAQIVLDFVSKNKTCTECTQSSVSWISTSLGCSLCEECATAHRQLGWAVSKLKNIALDEFYEWQMKTITEFLGNQVVNSIWEIAIPQGWKKPTPSSSMEEKTNYVIGKYKWYGFVDEFSAGDKDLSDGVSDASIAGNVPQIMWWMSHKADVNSMKEGRHGRTCLHEAVDQGHIHATAFLLQNGADLYIKDDRGQTALDLAQNIAEKGDGNDVDRENYRKIINMLLAIQRGDY